MRNCIGFKKDGWFSPAVEAKGLVFISGQGPVGPAGGDEPSDTFEGQVRQTFENLIYVIDKAGYSINDVVKINAYLSDISNFHKFNQVYLKYIPEPRPARTTVQTILVNGAQCEIDCVLLAH
jgi:2-iminobutanoate/2-iminopropanoate deaminase